MPTVDDIQQRIETVAASIDMLKDPKDPVPAATAARLRDLGVALAGGPERDQWAQCDLQRVIDGEQIGEMISRRKSTWDRRLEAMRSALVLLPLAVTWLGISLAVGAYSSLLADEPLEGYQSFIYLWQTGFGGRLGLNLGTVAAVDAVLLLIVFVLTVVVHVRNNERVAEAVKTAAQVSSALADADLILSQWRQPQPYAAIGQLETMARQILDDMRQDRDHLRQLAQEREQEVQGLSAFTYQLQQGSQSIAYAAQSLQDASNQMGARLTTLAGSVDHLVNQQAQMIPVVQSAGGQLVTIVEGQNRAVDFLHDLQQKGQDMVGRLQTVAQNIESGIQRVETAADGVGAAVGTVAKAADRVADVSLQVPALVTSLAANADRFSASVTGVAQAGADMAGSAAQLATMAGGLDKTQAELNTSMGAFGQTMVALAARQDAAATHLEDIARVQEQGAGSIASAATHVQQLQGQIGATAGEIATIGSRLNTLAADVEQRASSIGDAADRLIQAHGQINDNVLNLQSTLGQLASQQGLLVPAVSDAATRMDMIMTGQSDAVKWLNSLVTQQQQLTHDLTTSLSVATNSASDVRQAAASLTAVGTALELAWQGLSVQQSSLISTMEKERRAQELISSTLAQESAGIGEALKVLADFNTKFHAVVIDFASLSRDLPSVARSMGDMQTTLLRVAADNSSIGTDMTRAAQAVQQATSNLDTATQQFEPVMRSVTDQARALADAVAGLQQKVSTLKV